MSSTPMLASLTDAPAALPVEWVERLFARLGAIFGTKLADSFAGIALADVKVEWSEALADFRPEEIRRGIAECRVRRWPPMLGEFLMLCRPALDPEQAWHEAADGLRARDRGELGAWSHPGVWRAATALSSEVRNGAFNTHRGAWTHRLKVELRAGWGEDVPMPRAMLQAPPAAPAAPERVKAEVAKLLAGPVHEERGNAWGWARRLIEEHRSGRRLTTTTILRMAGEVLEAHGELAPLASPNGVPSGDFT